MGKRVLFVSHQANFIYGAEVCILEAMRAASPEFEAEFASPRGVFFDRAAALVPAHEIPSREFHRSLVLVLPTLLSWLKTWRALVRLARERRIDIVHAMTLKSMVYSWPLIFHGIPVYWHHHDILPANWGNWFWLQIIARGAAAIIVPSHATAKGLIGLGVSKHKIFVVPNGFAANSWKQKKEGFVAEKGKLQLGVIGEISYRKGLDRLRPFLDELQARATLEIQIHVIGAGLSDPEFATRVVAENQRYVDSGIVRFWGRQENIAEHLQKLDVLLLLSRQDPLPTVVIEAALSGVPTIGFAVGGVPEMIDSGATGILVSTVEELADGIERLRKDPEQIDAMGKRARVFAETRYSAKQMARSLVAIYRSQD